MIQSMFGRSLFWIGWVVWLLLTPWLLMLLPDSLPQVTWALEDGVFFVTWEFLIAWTILFWWWPFVFRFSGAVRISAKVGRGIWQGLVNLLLAVPFVAVVFIWLAAFLAMVLPSTPVLAIWSAPFLVPVGVTILFGAISLIVLLVMAVPAIPVAVFWLVAKFLHVLFFRGPIREKFEHVAKALMMALKWWWLRAKALLNLLWRFPSWLWRFVARLLAPVTAFLLRWWWGARRVLRPVSDLSSRIGPNARLLNAMRNNPLFFITWLVLLAGWQVVSYVAPEGTLEHPLVPGWDYVFGNTLFRMSGDWLLNAVPVLGVEFRFEELAPYPALAGDEARTWPAVFLALGFHSFMTLSRLVVGLALGLLVGIATGVAIPYWPVLRQTAWAPMNFLRMIPLLAAIPWLQFGLGANFRGAVAFIAFGVWVTLVVATMNSVANVPDRYIESARTLGASRPYTYFKVIVPGSLPELRTALLLSAGLGWSLTIAAEFLGFPTGLGHMASIAVQETNTARLVIVAFVVACYSLLTFYLLNQMFNRLVSWMPRRVAGTTDISKVAGAAGTARAEAGFQEG